MIPSKDICISIHQNQKVLEIKIQKKGTGKKYGNSKRKNKNGDNHSQGK